MENDKMVYTNHVGYPSILDKYNRNIIRDVGYNYNVKCTIDRRGLVSNDVNRQNEHTGKIEKIWFIDQRDIEDSIANVGKFFFRMNVYKSAAFKEQFVMADFPIPLQFYDIAHIGLETITKTPNKYIFTEECWATPNADPNHQDPMAYTIIQNGCPLDSETTNLETRVNLEDRFSTQTFRFPDKYGRHQDNIYIQCTVVVCDTTVHDETCMSTCRANDGAWFKPVDKSVSRADSRYRREANNKMRRTMVLGPFEVESKTMAAEQPASAKASPLPWFLFSALACCTLGLAAKMRAMGSRRVTSDVQLE